ncbi:hypothetical protein [Pseudoclavibacter helvolus]|uniref:hypothetical protein n=1 Tax=Pseudoclavibacter helvolus TaxID=255205 RepID=UPI003C70FA25
MYGNDDEIGYENTMSAEAYAWGCACTSCRTESRDYIEGERCTATRYADSFA